MTKQLVSIIIILGSLNIFSQDGTFEYNNQIITKYSIIALEEYNANTPKASNNLERDYNLKKSTSYGRLVTDCEGNMVQVIMVVFPHIKGKGSAEVHLTYSKDKFIGEILNRGYSIQSANKAIEGFKESDFGEFLFGCGL